MEHTLEFIKRLNAKLTAWYLGAKGDYSSCDTCGSYDNTKPEREELDRLIQETLDEMQNPL